MWPVMMEPALAFPADLHDLPLNTGLEVSLGGRPRAAGDIVSLASASAEERPADNRTDAELVVELGGGGKW